MGLVLIKMLCKLMIIITNVNCFFVYPCPKLSILSKTYNLHGMWNDSVKNVKLQMWKLLWLMGTNVKKLQMWNYSDS